MVGRAAVLAAWLARKLRRDPEGLLSLLIEAHHIDKDRASTAESFRAGMAVALKYPDAARRALGLEIETTQ
jgi:hypothetical protein